MTLPLRGLGRWWRGQKLRTLIGSSPFRAHLEEDDVVLPQAIAVAGAKIHMRSQALRFRRGPPEPTGLASRERMSRRLASPGTWGEAASDRPSF
jgi:hypothetical protein